MKQGVTSERLLVWVPLALLFLVAATFAYACFFAFPQTDDFCTFGRLIWRQDGNPFAETYFLYQNWTGRYGSSFVISLAGWLSTVMPIPPYWTYSVFLLAMLVVFSLSLMASIGLLLRDRPPERLPIILPAALLWAGIVVLMPSKLEGLLWLTGAAVYTLGIALLVLIASKLRPDDQGATGLGQVPASVLLLIFLCVGFNELIALSLGIYLGLRVLAFPRRQAWKQHAVLMAVFIVSVLVTALAPGNFVRDANITAVRHDLSAAFTMATHSLQLFGLPHRTVTLGVLSGLVAAGWLLAARSSVIRVQFRTIFPLVASLVIALPVHAVVYSFLTGDEVPGRVINQAYAMGLIGFGLLAIWCGMGLATADASPAAEVRARTVALVSALLIVSCSQFREVGAVLRDFGPTWRSEQIQRHHKLVSASIKGLDSVELTAFSTRAVRWPLLQGSDVTNDPAYWINGCVAGYYGLATVYLATDKVEIVQ